MPLPTITSCEPLPVPLRRTAVNHHLRTKMEEPHIGFIGLGSAGFPLAACLARKGRRLLVRDADPTRGIQFVEQHPRCRVATASAESFSECEVVITMLPSDSVVKHVLLGSTIIDTSSCPPLETRALGLELSRLNVELVDSPVTQEHLHAIDSGHATLMVGCDNPETLEKVTPILNDMSAHLFPMGGLGTGHTMQALNNYVGVGSMIALCDALVTGRRLGLDPHTMIEAMNVGTGANFLTKYSLKNLESKDSGFQLELLVKDVKIAKDLIEKSGFQTDLPSLALTYLEEASQSAPNGADYTACLESWEHRATLNINKSERSEGKENLHPVSQDEPVLRILYKHCFLNFLRSILPFSTLDIMPSDPSNDGTLSPSRVYINRTGLVILISPPPLSIDVRITLSHWLVPANVKPGPYFHHTASSSTAIRRPSVNQFSSQLALRSIEFSFPSCINQSYQGSPHPSLILSTYRLPSSLHPSSHLQTLFLTPYLQSTMKAREVDSDRIAEVNLHRNGRVSELDEFGEYCDPNDGAICSYVPVSDGDVIKIGGKCAGTTVAISYDVAIDGILRKAKHFEPKHVGRTNMKVDCDKFWYKKDKAIIETDAVVEVEPDLNVTQKDQPETIGTIDIRLFMGRKLGDTCSVGNNRTYYNDGMDIDLEDPNTDGNETPLSPITYRNIAQDVKILFNRDCAALDSRAVTRNRTNTDKKRPGKVPWAVFRFHLRSLDAIELAKMKQTFDPNDKKASVPHALKLEKVPPLEASPKKAASGVASNASTPVPVSTDATTPNASDNERPNQLEDNETGKALTTDVPLEQAPNSASGHLTRAQPPLTTAPNASKETAPLKITATTTAAAPPSSTVSAATVTDPASVHPLPSPHKSASTGQKLKRRSQPMFPLPPPKKSLEALQQAASLGRSTAPPTPTSPPKPPTPTTPGVPIRPNESILPAADLKVHSIQSPTASSQIAPPAPALKRSVTDIRQELAATKSKRQCIQDARAQYAEDLALAKQWEDELVEERMGLVADVAGLKGDENMHRMFFPEKYA
ncbi:unnamed protein product [Periconia digitata]|uniref:3-hydroxyisobutyrate dehydrogenase n=1 Tax=Periconia digitata TaxID=1303443 RepID=A0A9W4UWK8_9PLEO|nr:unnamed protein product [Periconia digitata]